MMVGDRDDVFICVCGWGEVWEEGLFYDVMSVFYLTTLSLSGVHHRQSSAAVQCGPPVLSILDLHPPTSVLLHICYPASAWSSSHGFLISRIIQYFNARDLQVPKPMAARSKVCGRSLAGVAGSNSTDGIDVCLS